MLSLGSLVCVLALTLTVRGNFRSSSSFSSSSSSSGDSCPREYHYDLPYEELRELYNRPVLKAELVKRPLGGTSRCMGIICHSGVRVTVSDRYGDEEQYLIHKGNDYGISSDTVVVKAEHMSDDWSVRETNHLSGRSRVADFVNAGGEEYNVGSANCHHAANAMMKLP